MTLQFLKYNHLETFFNSRKRYLFVWDFYLENDVIEKATLSFNYSISTNHVLRCL